MVTPAYRIGSGYPVKTALGQQAQDRGAAGGDQPAPTL